MYRLRILFFLTLVAALQLFLSCDKKDDPGNPDEPLVFSSLQADSDTICQGSLTDITAVATGYRLTFNWSATVGDFLGSGSQVTYLATPCQIGRNKITCTVKDGNNVSESKEIFIVVE